MISEKEVKHIAKLARLGLSGIEIKKMRKGLSSILDYFNLLKEVDAKEVKKIGEKGLLGSVTRKDIAEKESPEITNKLVKAAPRREKRYIKVKAVF